MPSNYSASMEQSAVIGTREDLRVSRLFETTSQQILTPTLRPKHSSSSSFDPVKATSGGDAIAPRAKLLRTNVTTLGSTYTFKVIYTTRKALKKPPLTQEIF
jgi:hypothetical protein